MAFLGIGTARTLRLAALDHTGQHRSFGEVLDLLQVRFQFLEALGIRFNSRFEKSGVGHCTKSYGNTTVSYMTSATVLHSAPPPDCAARIQFHLLEQWMASPSALQLPLHLVEQQQDPKGREVQRLLLQAHVQLRGIGDAGPALALVDGESLTLLRHRRLQRRTLKTVFGSISIHRIGYGGRGHPSIHPLDADLQLPQRSFSYELQRRLVKAALQGPFREATSRIFDSTGLTIHNHSLEPLLIESAADFDAFYQQPLADSPQPSASLLVVAVDCKGIPMVKPEPNRPPLRIAKEQKTNKKKMATVAAVFTKAPFIRTPQQLVDSIFRPASKDAAAPSPSKPENKRVWASLTKGKSVVMDEVRQEVLRRDPDGIKTLVALTDGERALQIRVIKSMKLTLILDLIHVLERVWRAAHVFQPEGTAEAEVHAKLMALRLLQGDVAQVIKGLRQTVTKRRLIGRKKKALLEVAGYFENNAAYMRYHEYLALGFPIASGPVEGACKNLIKDRMERSGMRWTPSMAEAIVKLRSLYLSGDLEDYWPFHIAQDQLRLHPPGFWSVVLK